MPEQTSDTPAGDWRDAMAAAYRERRSALVSRLMDLRGKIADLERQDAALLTELRELDNAARVFGIEQTGGATVPVSGQAMKLEAGQVEVIIKKPFKDVALEALETAYPKPLKAAKVREIGQRELGETFHPKTAGMTLYRLSQEGLVRREGHNWFFVPEGERKLAPDKENPGSAPDKDDPGSLFN